MKYLFFILLFSCQSVPSRSEPLTFKDLEILVDGVPLMGIGVLPTKETYYIEAHSRHHPQEVDVTTCNRAVPPFYLGRFKKTLRWQFTPTQVEDGDCIIKISFLDAKDRSQFAAMILANPLDSLVGKTECNGQVLETNGTTFCQSMAGTNQQISFSAQALPVSECELPKNESGDRLAWKYSAKEGYCTYIFKTKDGKSHRLVNFGFTGFPNP